MIDETYQAEVLLPQQHWNERKKAALFLLPAIHEIDGAHNLDRKALEAQASERAEAAKQSAQVKNESDLKLSSTAITNLFRHRPQGHQKVLNAVEGVNAMALAKNWPERLHRAEIVACVFVAPRLDAHLDHAGLTPETFAQLPDAQHYDEALIKAMLNRERVPLSVAIRVAMMLREPLEKNAKGDRPFHFRDFITASNYGKDVVPTNGKDLLFDGDDLLPAWKRFPDWTDWRNPKDLPDGVPEEPKKKKGKAAARGEGE